MKIAVNTSISIGDLDFSGFEKLGEIVYFRDPSKEELIAAAADCDAIMINKEIITEEVLDACPRIKYIGVFATGYNVVDLEACRKRGITVTNVPGYSTNSVAQHVFALVLAIYDKIREYTSSVDAGDWVKSKTFNYFPWPTFELSGKTFGILGYGSIGKTVAKIAEAFGMNVVVSTRTFPKNCPYKVAGLDELLAESDILSLHCPLTPATDKIINASTLAKMKNGAVLINTARGGLLDEAAVRAALDSGKLSAAGIDVVTVEPMRPGNPLLNAKNCLITPHVAWCPLEARIRLLDVALDNLRGYLRGEPKNVV